MTDTTTIQITTEQRDELDQLKEHQGEPYKSVLQGLITHYNASGKADTSVDEARVREIVRDEINDRVTPRALE